MEWYIFCILIGILLYLFVNIDRFIIGGPNLVDCIRGQDENGKQGSYADQCTWDELSDRQIQVLGSVGYSNGSYMDDDSFSFTEPQTVELLEAGFSPSWINSHNSNVDAPIIGGGAAAVAGPFCNPVRKDGEDVCAIAVGGGGRGGGGRGGGGRGSRGVGGRGGRGGGGRGGGGRGVGGRGVGGRGGGGRGGGGRGGGGRGGGGGCQDLPARDGSDWVDGSNNGCSAYETGEAAGRNWCLRHGGNTYGGQGTANTHCCICGGGAGGGAGGAGGAAGGGGGGAGGADGVATDVPPINLHNVSVDSLSRGPIQIIGSDCKPITQNITRMIQHLKLKYTLDGTEYPLMYVSFLNSGSFGDVCKYASSSDTTSPQYFAIAVKFYKFSGNSEEEVIDLINSERSFDDCNTVSALVLRYNIRGVENSVGLMQLMDGDLIEYIRVHNPNNLRLKFMMREIVIDLKCISDAGYSYADLKLINVLYKMIDGLPIFRLGDLDSIVSRSSTGHVIATSQSVEFIIRGRRRPRDKDVYWGIGCMLVEALYFLYRWQNYFGDLLRKLDRSETLKYIRIPDEYYTILTRELRRIHDGEAMQHIPIELYEVLRITLRAQSTRVQADTGGREGYDRLIRLFS